MRLPSWLRRLVARPALAPAPRLRRPARCRLMLEVLEARDCPSAGSLDPTFGSGGSFTFPNPPGQYSVFNSLALEGDGSIVVGGIQSNPSGATPTNANPHEMLLGHLTAAGAADTSFGPAGTGFTTVPDGQNSEVWGMAIDRLQQGL